MKVQLPTTDYMIKFAIATVILSLIVKMVVPESWKSYFRV